MNKDEIFRALEEEVHAAVMAAIDDKDFAAKFLACKIAWERKSSEHFEQIRKIMDSIQGPIFHE